MHIPDFIFGYSPYGIVIGIIACIIAAILVGFSIRWAIKNMTTSKLVILAVIAAGIFALQAFNLPTGFGVSGHLVGGALAAIILGSPFASIFILTIVLLIQALIFGDGGVLALGLNIINMGAIAGFIGFYSYKLCSKKLPKPVSAGIAGWLACVIAAICCALELALVGAVPLIIGLPTMAIYHALIGIVEGIVTAIIVALIFKVRPELTEKHETKNNETENTEAKSKSLKTFLIVGLLIALAIFCAAFFLASGSPDGLDSTFLVSEGQKEIFAPATGDEVTGEENNPINWNAPIPDYAFGDSSLTKFIILLLGIVAAITTLVILAKVAYAKQMRKINEKEKMS